MKKIISMILVIALFASLAVAVSAHSGEKYPENFVEHAYIPLEVNQIGGIDWKGTPGGICNFYELMDDNGWLAFDGKNWVAAGTYFATQEYRRSSDMTDILAQPKDVTLGRVKCAEAITSDEMEAAVTEWNAAHPDQEIKHMTVFWQRNLAGVKDGDTIDVKLWPAAKKNAVVVLTEVDGCWKIVAVSAVGEEVVTAAPLTGATGMTVCMTW